MTQTTARLEIARLMRSWKHIFGQLVLHADKTEKSHHINSHHRCLFATEPVHFLHSIRGKMISKTDPRLHPQGSHSIEKKFVSQYVSVFIVFIILVDVQGIINSVEPTAREYRLEQEISISIWHHGVFWYHHIIVTYRISLKDHGVSPEISHLKRIEFL